MKREPDYKLKKRLERMEHEKKMNRTYNRNWIICIGSRLRLLYWRFLCSAGSEVERRQYDRVQRVCKR